MITISKEERWILLKKYMHNPEEPLDFENAVKKVNKFHDYLKDLRDKLRRKGKSDNDIEIKFKEEFEKLVQKLA